MTLFGWRFVAFWCPPRLDVCHGVVSDGTHMFSCYVMYLGVIAISALKRLD